jgi:hypothetical protein
MGKSVGGKCFCGIARLVFGVFAAALFSALVLTGCGKDDNPAVSNAGLICEEGEAWVDPPPSPYGMVLKEDGSLILIQQSDNTWSKIGESRWSVEENRLTFFEQTYPYSVSGNTLTLTVSPGMVAISTKKSGIYY